MAHTAHLVLKNQEVQVQNMVPTKQLMFYYVNICIFKSLTHPFIRRPCCPFIPQFSVKLPRNTAVSECDISNRENIHQGQNMGVGVAVIIPSTCFSVPSISSYLIWQPFWLQAMAVVGFQFR